MAKSPINVCVTGAAGQIAYSLSYLISKGDVFGADQPINLRLLDIEPMMETLQGVIMELMDCALPLLKELVGTYDAEVAFKDIDAAFLVGAMPRKAGMERKDLLKANVGIFAAQGRVLDKVAKKTVKVLVVGNPANTNAAICSKCAPSIPPRNFSAMTRLDQNRTTAQIAAYLGIGSDSVKNAIIWGNHSSTQFPDVKHASVLQDGKWLPVYQCIHDLAWLQDGLVSTVQKRGAAVIAARKLSSAMSAAKAACDHMHDWWHGTPRGIFVSMAVKSQGAFGVPCGVFYSFPVTIIDGDWRIVSDLEFDEFSRQKMELTGKELVEELNEAEQFLKSSQGCV